ncbi:MAG: RsmE family RNA methyltransferase [Acidimicrobiales bacterium]
MSLLEWPRRVAAIAQFRVGDPSQPTLTATDEHHLRTVLRAKSGEEIVVTDGAGAWSLAEVGDHALHRVTPVHVDPPTPQTTLYLAPLKGDRSEWTVVKATELGVQRIVPLMSARVVVRFRGETRDKIVARWKRVANEANGQSRRTYDVLIDEPIHVRDVPVNVAFTHFDGDGDWNGVHSVCVGPEGGWDEGESGEHPRLSLGPTVLRAETAGVVAASLLAFGAGGWGFTLTDGKTR